MAKMILPEDPQTRKNTPITTGVLDYFPLALAAVAQCSKAGNDQHNPGQPLHWAKGKSTDHADCIARHLIDRGTTDTDGIRHSALNAVHVFLSPLDLAIKRAVEHHLRNLSSLQVVWSDFGPAQIQLFNILFRPPFYVGESGNVDAPCQGAVFWDAPIRKKFTGGFASVMELC